MDDRELQAADSAPSLPESIIPDIAQMASANILADYAETLPIARQVCDDTVAAILSDYNAAIESCRRECDQAQGNCAGCYLATLNDYANRINAVSDKCKAAVVAKLSDVMGTALNYALSIGVPEVQESQVLHNLNLHGFGNLPPPSPPPPPQNPICPPGYYLTGFLNSDGTPQCLPYEVHCGPGTHGVTNPDGTPGCAPDSPVTPPPPPGGPTGPGGPGGGGPGGPGGGGQGGECGSTEPCKPPPDLGFYTNPDGSLVYGKWIQVHNDKNCALGCVFVPCNCVISGTEICSTPCRIICNDLQDCIKNPPGTCPDQYHFDLTTNSCVRNSADACVEPTAQNPSMFPPQNLPAGWRAGRDNLREPPNWYAVRDSGWEACYQWSDEYNWPVCVLPNGNVELAIWISSDNPPDCRWQHLQEGDICGRPCNTSEIPPPPPPPPPSTDVIGYCKYSPDHFEQPRGYHAGSLSSLGVETVADFVNGIESGSPATSSFLSSFFSVVLGPLYIFGTKAISGAVKDGYTFAVTTAASAIQDLLPCSNTEYSAAVISQILVGIFDKFGFVPAAVSAEISYAQNWNCQYLIPEQGSIDGAYIRGFINKDRWTDATKMHGYCIPWKEVCVDAEFVYPNIAQTIDAFRRGFIEQQEYDDWMIRTGIKDNKWADRFKKLAEYQIPLDTAILQEVRGVADDQLAQFTGVDDGFSEWLDGSGQQAYKASGYDRENALRLWRSSQRLPDIFVAMDAFRRLKESGEVPGTGFQYEAVTEDDLRAVGVASGYPGKWANRLAALAYSPISIRHLRLLYEGGQYDVDALTDGYSKAGYSPKDSRDLAKALAATTDQQKAKLAGFPDVTTVLRLYKSDGLSQQDAIDMLQQAGLPFEQVGMVLNSANMEREAERRKQLVSALKKRFMDGDYDVGQVTEKLQNYGVTVERVGDLVHQWQEELSLVHKLPAAANLCDWFTRRFISVDDYMQRMSNLGYDSASSALFVNNCVAAAATKAAKESAAEAKQKASAEKARLKEEQKAIKDAAPCKPPPKPVCGAAPKKKKGQSSPSSGSVSPA